MVERVGENASRGESRYGCPVRPPIPLVVEAAAARAAGALSRLAGRGGGTTLPGKLLSKGDPAAIDRPAAGPARVHRRPKRPRFDEGADPRAGALAQGGRGPLVLGPADPRQAGAELQHAADSKYCLRCGAPYTYAAAYVGHLGDYMCPNCGHGRPPLELAARAVELDGLEAATFDLAAPEGTRRIRLGLPGLYNVYNAL